MAARVPANPVTDYARAVQVGRILAGPHVRAACARHLRDLTEARKRGFVFDVALMQKAFDFFTDILCLNSGEFEGLPFILSPWEQFVVGSIFGWRDPQGRRRFRVCYVETGKGSGKSPLAAGIGLYMLVADNEARAEVYAAASKKDQAMVLFRDAVAMVQLSPSLDKRVHQTGGRQVWNLSFRTSFFRPIASDEGQSGPRPHCGLIDEVHEHADDNVVEMMRAGFKHRRQPLLFMITNAGIDRESVCWHYHDRAVKIAGGMLEDDRFFSYVCALDEGEDPLKDERCWPKTNPNLGVSIQAEYLRDQVREARQMPSKESTVRRLHFCQWVDAASPWISGEAWRACEADVDEPLEVQFERRRVILAVDLSLTTDLAALAAVSEDEGGSGAIDAAVEFWTPEDTLQARAERDGVDYPLWVKQGHLHAVPGKTLNYRAIAERIVELGGVFEIVALVFDRWRMGYLRRELDDLGAWFAYVEHPQTFIKLRNTLLWMPQSINELEAAVLAGLLHVRRNPVLTWNAANAVTESDLHESRVFSKRKSTGRIDGIVALAMGVGALKAGQGVDISAMIG